MAILLRASGLKKWFGTRKLFDIAELTIKTATAYVLTGPNGSGKSTLLRMLSGLEPANANKCFFDGQLFLLNPYPRLMRDSIIYVRQHPIMFSTSVAHNIGYGLVARGKSKDEIRRSVQAAMAWAEVEHLRDASPAFLSGGEKQRIALARAKVLAPKLLLLDEPTSNLDGAAREKVIALIPKLVNEGGSVIMACHDRDLINLAGMHRIKLGGEHLHRHDLTSTTAY